MAIINQSTWQSIKFRNFVKLQRGFDLPQQDRIKGQYPVIASTSITAFHNKYKVKAPCVTTGRSGALGKVLYTDIDCWPLNTTLWVKDFCGNNPKFVYYKLKTLDLEKFNAGAGVPTLNKNHLDALNIKIPNPKTQARIASVLSAYDDLIKNNEKRIKTLEEMAQLLYTEWFVKFKFPGHEKVKMVDSGTEYGKIPEGWEVVTIESLLGKVKRKAKIQASEYLPLGEFPIVDQGREFIAGYTDNKDAVYDQDIIVFGDHSRCFKYCNFPFACGADGTQLLLTNDSKRMPEILLYYVVLNSGLQNFNYARHFKFLKSIQAIKPDSLVARKFGYVMDGTYLQIKALRAKNHNLSKIRDHLIPQLVTGRGELK